MIHAQKTDTLRKRNAFTLVEILIVMAIMAVLVALTAAAVGAARGKATTVQCAVEIAQLAEAHGAARMELNNVDYLPSQIKLCRTVAEYGVTTLDVNSRAFLYRAFGRRLWSGGAIVQWDGGQSGNNGPWILNGDQALVFWLGGIPTANGGTSGFSTDATNPSSATGTRKGPYFTFKTTRMVFPPIAVAPAVEPKVPPYGFYRYIDPFILNQPYLYFSSYRAGNDYQADNALFGVSPYVNSGTGRAFNEKGFQIISAGRNGVFGAGGGWDPTNGYTTLNQNGFDDQSNFSGAVLGVPQS